MSVLTQIGSIPGVRSAVLGDRAGVLLDSVREPDAEATAAISGYLAGAIAEAGSQLGLGELVRLTLAGAARACLLAVTGGTLVTARIEPATALQSVEKVFESSIAGQG